MRTGTQVSTHLLMAGVISVFSVVLILVTLAMSWELWMIPLIALSCLAVWWLHIGKIGSEILYENMCTGLMLGEFFFFGVHKFSLYEVPVAACVLLVALSFFNRKRLLYMAVAFYSSVLLYHFLFLYDITYDMEMWDAVRLGIGAVSVSGVCLIARYRINRNSEEVARYKKMLAQLQTAKRQNADFLSNVSHELRTPINMVIGIGEVALCKENLEEIHEDIQSIKMAGKRLSSQINNILDYTEIVEGTLTAAKEEYSITSVVNDVITMTTLQSSRHHLEMVFDIDPKIPSVLIGDAEKISHALKILVENSIKFTEEGGISVCIRFRRESYGANLIIDICDTGIGMTADQLAQMADDFYQADSGSRRYSGGLGLGLPVARGLLHSMGGFIHFESKEQQGMQTHIIIPQGVGDDTPGISAANAGQLCIACYFKPERFGSDEVRRYYDNLILHLVEGLGVEGYQAHNFEGLEKLQREHKLTHMFIAQSEYMENSAYYEEMAEKIRVVVIADRKFVLGRNSRLMLIRKPFSALSIVNLLNGQVEGNGFEESRNPERRPFSCEGVRALAVDDEEMNLVVAKGVLGSYGIKVDTCLSGKLAVERCSRMSYDIIFLDHMMPGFDGVETLLRIREIKNGKYRDLPIIALTANTISGAREMFKSEGFTEFIPKPIERSVLERVLRRVLPKECFRYDGEKAVLTERQEEKKVLTAEYAQLPERTGDSAEMPERATGSTEANCVPAAGDEAPMAEQLSAYDTLTRAGINVEMGLDYCVGEEDFYQEMLQMFDSQAEEKKQELDALYREANWKDYAVKAHALKSTSLTIGAERLSAHAKTLEQAGKRGDVEYIRDNHLLLLNMYEDVCRSITEYLGNL